MRGGDTSSLPTSPPANSIAPGPAVPARHCLPPSLWHYFKELPRQMFRKTPQNRDDLKGDTGLDLSERTPPDLSQMVSERACAEARPDALLTGCTLNGMRVL